MAIYALWNNKGGVGKSYLTFQVAAEYARTHRDQKVLVIDLCPQANSSSVLLGGIIEGEKSPRQVFGDESKEPPEVRRAVERIAEAARKANKPISVYTGNATEAAWLGTLGATVFVLSSDQGFLRQAAASGLRDVRDKVGAGARA